MACGLRHVIAFHAQQAVEKYLKAVLVRHQIYFPGTHDTGKILDLVEQREPAMVATLRAAAGLTRFGVEVRYPGDAPELLPGEEAGVIEIASRVRDAVIGLLRHYLSVQT